LSFGENIKWVILTRTAFIDAESKRKRFLAVVQLKLLNNPTVENYKKGKGLRVVSTTPGGMRDGVSGGISIDAAHQGVSLW
jgi:hypothetical protein